MTYTFKLARRLAVSRTLGMLRPDAPAVPSVFALTRRVARAAAGRGQPQEPAPPKGVRRGSPRSCRRALAAQVEESRLAVEEMKREWRRFRDGGEIALILCVLGIVLAAYSNLTWLPLSGSAGLTAIAWGLFRQSNRYLAELKVRQEVYDSKRKQLNLFDLLGGGPASVQVIASVLLEQ